MQEDFNEMVQLERKIIQSYNKLLKGLLDEGDMETLERVIVDDEYREQYRNAHVSALQKEMKLL